MFPVMLVGTSVGSSTGKPVTVIAHASVRDTGFFWRKILMVNHQFSGLREKEDLLMGKKKIEGWMVKEVFSTVKSGVLRLRKSFWSRR